MVMSKFWGTDDVSDEEEHVPPPAHESIAWVRDFLRPKSGTILIFAGDTSTNIEANLHLGTLDVTVRTRGSTTDEAAERMRLTLANAIPVS